MNSLDIFGYNPPDLKEGLINALGALPLVGTGVAIERIIELVNEGQNYPTSYKVFYAARTVIEFIPGLGLLLILVDLVVTAVRGILSCVSP